MASEAMTSIAFAWDGLPDYGARCIRAVIDRHRSTVDVIATRANVPIEGMETSLGQPIHWIDGQSRHTTWDLLGLTVPEVLFCGGYATPAFNNLAREVRVAGGRVVLMSDNNWKGDLRSRVLNVLRHRLKFRHKFDAIFVPGVSGERVARSWGYNAQFTRLGLYGSDPALFFGGAPLYERPKRILFVGQFIDRKNIRGLVDAFVEFAESNAEWTLTLCGSGPLAAALPSHPRIEIVGFIQPPALAVLMRQVRCLILPSIEEHWGLVVHEAALSGCALALSNAVGAAADLARPENSVLFSSTSVSQISDSLAALAAWDPERWAQAEDVSRKLAAEFGPRCFSDSVSSLVDQFLDAGA